MGRSNSDRSDQGYCEPSPVLDGSIVTIAVRRAETGGGGMRWLFLVLLGILLGFPGQVQAGRHSQSTHSTPKGYHHDGTICFEAHPGEAVMILIVFMIMLLLVVVLMIRNLEPASSHAPRRCQPDEEPIDLLAGWMKLRADWTQARRWLAWLCLRANDWAVATFVAMPDWGQAVVLGLAMTAPVVVLMVYFLH